MKQFITLGVILVLLFSGTYIFMHITNRGDTIAEKAVSDSTQTEIEDLATVEEPTPTPEPTVPPKQTEFQEALESVFAQLDGECQWGVLDFNDGVKVISDRTGNKTSAGVINLFIMEYVLDRVHNIGDIALTDSISDSTFSSLLHAMIAENDNDATNLLIERFGMEDMNEFFASKGYGDTKLQRRMLDFDAIAAGKENYTSATDVILLLEKIYNNQNEPLYEDALYILKQQTEKSNLTVKLPEGVYVANKSGQLDTVQNDAGIVFTDKGDFAIVCLCSNLIDNDAAELAIARAARDIYLLLS